MQDKELVVKADGNVGSSRWLIEHLSGLTVGIVALVGSVFYYFGSLKRDYLAQEFGLASAPGPVSIQQVMADGATLILSTKVLGVFVLSLIAFVLVVMLTVSFVIWFLRKLGKKLNEKAVRERGLLSMPVVDKSTAVFGSLLLYAALRVAAHADAAEQSALVYRTIGADCATCRVFKTSSQEVLGVAVIQSDTHIFVASQAGLKPLAFDDLTLLAPKDLWERGRRSTKAGEVSQVPPPASNRQERASEKTKVR